MNLHTPQSLMAFAEVAEIMNVENQMVSPQNSGTLISLQQDSLISVYLLTRDPVPVLHIDLFCDCVMGIRHSSRALPPGNSPSGRDLVSLMLPPRLSCPGVANGVVVSALDNKKMRNIVHCVFLDYSPHRAMTMVSDLQRVLCRWQESVAFSVGLEASASIILLKKKKKI